MCAAGLVPVDRAAAKSAPHGNQAVGVAVVVHGIACRCDARNVAD